jgi:ribonuclease R
VVNWLKCEYLIDRVGEKYAGVVSAVTGFGLFVMLDDLYVEGLIHVTGLPKDYYYHEASHHRMVGERTGRIFRLGQKLQVRLTRVNLEERKIDFELVEPGRSETSGPGLGAKPGKKTRVSPKAAALAAEHEKKRKSRGKKKTGAAGKRKTASKRRKSTVAKTAGGQSASAKSRGKKKPRS